MFELLELLAELRSLKEIGMSDEEIEGFLEMFFDNLTDDIEVV